MKRYFLAILVGLLFISNSLHSQSMTGYMWQLQNPKETFLSELMGFDTETFLYMSIDLKTRETSVSNGTYKIAGNEITLKFENRKKTVYKMTWVSVNKVIFTHNKDSFIYVKFKTAEDQFMEYKQALIKEQKNCDICYGEGICLSCGGLGIYSVSGFSSPCAACSATGRCWKCKK